MSAPVSSIPKFVDQYYKTSTFHHLSSWKAKQFRFAEDAKKEKPANLCVYDTLDTHSEQTSSEEPKISCFAYIDMDCFYVSVERRDNPSLDGQKVIVCPTSNLSHKSLENSTSEISSASYEARACGVKSRMFLKDAYKLCPDAVFLPCNYKRYEQTSDLLYTVLRKYTKSVQPISADEAALDLSNYTANSPMTQSKLEELIQEIRDDIQNTTGCPCSAGVATNLLLAKLAVTKAKPNGQKVISKAEVPRFLMQVPVQQLPRVGEVLTAKLLKLEVSVVSDLLRFTQSELQSEFGAVTGKLLFFFARGEDERNFQTNFARKSIGTQISWGIRFSTDLEVQKFLGDLATEVSQRMLAESLKGQKLVLTIKVKEGEDSESKKYMNPGRVNIVTKSSRLPSFTDDSVYIGKRCFQLFRDSEVNYSDVRGLGIQMEKLNNQNSNSQPKKLFQTPKRSALGVESSTSSQTKLTSFFGAK